MSKVVTIQCDVDQKPGAREHRLVLDGVSTKFDLDDACFDKLVKAVEPFTSKGTASTPGAAGVSEFSKIRTWAKENNLPCPDKGRVPTATLNAFNEAHAA